MNTWRSDGVYMNHEICSRNLEPEFKWIQSHWPKPQTRFRLPRTPSATMIGIVYIKRNKLNSDAQTESSGSSCGKICTSRALNCKLRRIIVRAERFLPSSPAIYELRWGTRCNLECYNVKFWNCYMAPCFGLRFKEIMNNLQVGACKRGSARRNYRYLFWIRVYEL